METIVHMSSSIISWMLSFGKAVILKRDYKLYSADLPVTRSQHVNMSHKDVAEYARSL